MSKKKRWSQEEIDFIKINYKNMTYEEIGNILGRTKKSVTHVGASLGLNRDIEIGARFNRLVVIGKSSINNGSQNLTIAQCKCDCGKDYSTRMSNLTSGRFVSCGCWKAEQASKRLKESNFKHGKADLKNNRLYRIWNAIKTRCYNDKTLSWKNYGGRGISMTLEWRNNFEVFEKWAVNNGYDASLSIDRIDVNGNYEPSNCRWVDEKTQSRNRRNNRQDTVKITAFGETQAIGNWLEDPRCAVKSIATICYRIGSGWTPEDAISKPSERK